MTNALRSASAMLRLRGATVGEACLLGYALWTVCSNLTALSGGGLRRLCLLFGLAASAAIVAAALCRWRSAPSRSGMRERLPHSGARHLAPMILLALAAAALTLVAHRPDGDDSHFVNWAVAAVDDPGLPILRFDTTLAWPGALIDLPVRKAQSFEMLGAAISWLLGLPAIAVFHLLLPPLAAVLVVAAHGQLLRTVAPTRWLAALIGVLLFLVLNGASHYSHGNFSFVRLQHGKAVFLSAMVPAILALAVRFARRPTLRLGMLLAAAQIGAVGLTSSALWAGPAIAGLGVIAGLPRSSWRDQLRRLALGAATSSYVVLLAMVLRFGFDYPTHHTETELGSFDLLATSAARFFGSPLAILGAGLLLALATCWSRERLARRLIVALTSGVALLLANPLLAGSVAASVTSVTTYWRVFWLLPIPLAAGLVASAPLSCRQFPGDRHGRCLGFVVSLVALYWLAGAQPTLVAANRTRIDWPGLKVTPQYRVAVALHDAVPRGTTVIAPQQVSCWLTTLHRHPLPLLARNHHASIHGEEGARRLELKLYVAGSERPPAGPELLRSALGRYRVRAVCLPTGNPWGRELRSLLLDSGFELRSTSDGYEIWVAAGGRVAPG